MSTNMNPVTPRPVLSPSATEGQLQQRDALAAEFSKPSSAVNQLAQTLENFDDNGFAYKQNIKAVANGVDGTIDAIANAIKGANRAIETTLGQATTELDSVLNTVAKPVKPLELAQPKSDELGEIPLSLTQKATNVAKTLINAIIKGDTAITNLVKKADVLTKALGPFGRAQAITFTVAARAAYYAAVAVAALAIGVPALILTGAAYITANALTFGGVNLAVYHLYREGKDAARDRAHAKDLSAVAQLVQGSAFPTVAPFDVASYGADYDQLSEEEESLLGNAAEFSETPAPGADLYPNVDELVFNPSAPRLSGVQYLAIEDAAAEADVVEANAVELVDFQVNGQTVAFMNPETGLFYNEAGQEVTVNPLNGEVKVKQVQTV